MIVKARPKIAAVFLHNVGREFMTFLISITGAVLFETLLWRLAGHAYI